MAELLTANERTSEVATGWVTWISTAERVTDQARSGVASTKFTSSSTTAGLLLNPKPISSFARIISCKGWIRTTRTQMLTMYMRRQNATQTNYFDVTLPVYLVANTWVDFLFEIVVPFIIPNATAPVPITHVQIFAYATVSQSGDVYWLDDFSMQDDTGVGGQHWNGSAWVPLRTRVY